MEVNSTLPSPSYSLHFPYFSNKQFVSKCDSVNSDQLLLYLIDRLRVVESVMMRVTITKGHDQNNILTTTMIWSRKRCEVFFVSCRLYHITFEMVPTTHVISAKINDDDFMTVIEISNLCVKCCRYGSMMCWHA